MKQSGLRPLGISTKSVIRSYRGRSSNEVRAHTGVTMRGENLTYSANVGW